MFIDDSNVAAVLAGLPGRNAGAESILSLVREDSEAPAPAMQNPTAPSLHEAISDLLAADPQTVTGGDALKMVQTLTRERRRLDAAYLRALALADQLDAAKSAGAASSTQGYLKSVLGVSAARAKADIAAAQAIHGGHSKELVAAAAVDAGALAPLGNLLADGTVGLAHVDVGVKTLENIPARLVCYETLERISGFLAGHAPTTTPYEIRVLSDRLIRNLEPDRDDHYDPESFNRRSFTMATDITGMVHGNYQLDPAAGAELRAIMDPLSAPKPDQTNEQGDVIARDVRSPNQRRADAFNELVRAGSTLLGPPAAPAAGEIPVASDGSPVASSGSQAPSGASGPGLFDVGFSGDGPAASQAGKLRLSRRQPRISIVTTMDQIQAMQQRRSGGNPFHAQDESEAFIPVDPTPSHCDQIGTISAGAQARMSCDGLFERVVLDAKGAILDLGLAVRLAAPAQRRALTARDRGCVVPGCDRPASWCEAHHVVWYSRGGPTEVWNLALLCTSHHSQVHAGELEVKMIDGIPYVRLTPRGCTAAIPIGAVRHPDHTDWIRNGYFDRLKSADAMARSIVIRAEDAGG